MTPGGKTVQPFTLSLETQQEEKKRKKRVEQQQRLLYCLHKRPTLEKKRGGHSNVKRALLAACPVREVQFRDLGVEACDGARFIRRQNLRRRQAMALSQ